MRGMEGMLEKMLGVSIPDIKRKAEEMVDGLNATLAKIQTDLRAVVVRSSNHDDEIAQLLTRVYNLEKHTGVEAPGELFAEEIK